MNGGSYFSVPLPAKAYIGSIYAFTAAAYHTSEFAE
jgi:hypothetical protein